MILKKSEFNVNYNEEQVPCKFCGIMTSMLGTELCDRCWELERRISNDIVLAEKILNNLKNTSS